MADEKTIFLVDDNLTNLTMGKAALKDKYKTFTMPSAEKMFALLQKIKPDIILLDIEMPEMSGTEAMQILKNSSDSSIPIIFLTADESAETKKEALELGAADYIPKPFSGEGLIQCIERALV